jgi:hypothetical protein
LQSWTSNVIVDFTAAILRLLEVYDYWLILYLFTGKC